MILRKRKIALVVDLEQGHLFSPSVWGLLKRNGK